MHQLRRAVTWETFNYPDHMQRACADDLIFMFAKGVGIIGVGRATGHYRVLPEGHPDRVANEPGYKQEWQIPVDWLGWQPNNPCVWGNYPVATFIDLSGDVWADRLQSALRHFGL